MRYSTTLATIAAALALTGCSREQAPKASNADTTAGESVRQDATAPLPPATNEPPLRDSYADIVARVAPSVVTVRAARRVRQPRQFPFFDDRLLEQFFGVPQRREPPRVAVGLGSGVITNSDGHLLTNHHVVDGAEEIAIEMQDRRVFKARLVGSDPPSDLAVLKIDAGGLPVLPPGNSDQVRVGDRVLALGNPLGLGQTVTAGIISAKGRATGLSDGTFEDFLQTDAPINQGNSGGALVNTRGELVGINSQILSTTGGNIGIGFAIPSNMAKNVMQQLISSGTVRRGQLGVAVLAVTSDVAQKEGLKQIRGVLVGDVASGGPADRAGIRKGDVIVSMNGSPVDDPNELRNRIAATQPGSEVTLSLMRSGREQQVKARLGELKVRPQEG